jgi:SAM-dependent methyltransferase
MSAKPPSSFLRTTFEEVADLYDCARPSYPDELFDDLAVVGELGHGSRVIEIGCGTGQATRPLAERGYQIICVELSEQMAAVARRNLARFGNVEVTTADFETWQPRECAFDAVVAFTALHWIAPEVRYEESASLLPSTESWLWCPPITCIRPEVMTSSSTCKRTTRRSFPGTQIRRRARRCGPTP